MDLYEAINTRRTIRDFEATRIPQASLERILSAGMKAPSGNHLRDVHFVVLRDKAQISQVVKLVGAHAEGQLAWAKSGSTAGSQKAMYLDAVPKQRQMLTAPGTLILPFFRHTGDFDESNGVTSYNNFASTWCAIENMLLAATAEGFGCAFRIPIGDEPAYIKQQLHIPGGYILACYLSVGYPAKGASIPGQVPLQPEDRIHYGTW